MDVKQALTQKIGPLPAFMWGGIIGGGLLVMTFIRKSRGDGEGGNAATEVESVDSTGYDFGVYPPSEGMAPIPAGGLGGTPGSALPADFWDNFSDVLAMQDTAREKGDEELGARIEKAITDLGNSIPIGVAPQEPMAPLPTTPVPTAPAAPDRSRANNELLALLRSKPNLTNAAAAYNRFKGQVDDKYLLQLDAYLKQKRAENAKPKPAPKPKIIETAGAKKK